MIFIVGEIGINHNGDIEIAKELIRVAKSCGCNAVKFQKRDINSVYDENFLNEERISPFGNTQRDQKEGLEFNEKEYKIIDNYCKLIGIDWYASVWDIKSFLFIKKFNLKYNKICSPMIVDEDLLNYVANDKKYTFISTGMSSEQMIDNAVDIFKKYDCPFELLHCVSVYPPNIENINLSKISTLKSKYRCNVGFSDHCLDQIYALSSCSLGVSSLEKHITLDKFMYGSDQKISLDPSELKSLIDNVRKIEISLGNGKLYIDKDEILVMNKLRSHLNN